MSKTLGFDHEGSQWEQKPLGSLGTTYTGLSGKTKEDFGKGGAKFITYMNVFSNSVANSEMLADVSVAAGEKQNEVQKGDILFTTSSETLVDVGRASLWWDDRSPVYLNSFCFGFRLNNQEVNPQFLVYALHSPKLREAVIRLGQGFTRVNLSKTKLMNVTVPVPSLAEQKQIGEFFSALDERIELQARKVGLLREQKHGYQQRVFNRELVFTDDNDNPYPDWEQKKLGEFLSIPRSQKVKPEDIDKEKLLTVKLHRKGILRNTRTDTLQIGATGYYTRKAGQLIWGRQNLHRGALGIIPPDLDGFLSSQFLPVLDIDTTKVNADFLMQFLGREVFYQSLEKIAVGTGSKLIGEKEVMNLTPILPSLPEQEKIAEFFSALDENIELNERKLSLLKEEKQGYLQAIFG